MIFPTQYATNRVALATDRLVKPPTLELIKLKERGMLQAKTAAKHKPPMRPARPFSSYTMIMPTMELIVLKIIRTSRDDGMILAKPEVRRRKTS